MLDQKQEELKKIIVRRVKSSFPNMEADYNISFEEGVDLFFDFISTPIHDDFAALDSVVISNLHEYYITGANYLKELDILKSLTTSLDPFLRKILFITNREKYDDLKSARKGLKDVIINLDLLIRDYRTTATNMLHGKDSILDSDRGKNHDFALLHKTRNEMAHNAPEYDAIEIAKRFISCINVYFYSFFVYLEELKPHIVHTNQTTSINEHSERALFFRHIDDWSNFIQNSSIDIDGAKHRGTNIAEALCNKIYDELDNEMVGLGRELLRERYNDQSVVQFLFSKLYKGISPTDLIKLTNHFISEMTKRNENDRWEYQKNHIGSTHYESDSEKAALNSLAKVNFYKIPFEDDYKDSRKSYYRVVMQKMLREYGSFIGGFRSCIESILNFISSSKNPNLYIEDLNSKFRSKYDFLLLLYLLLGDEVPPELLPKIKEFVNFDKLLQGSNVLKMIDGPTKIELKKEIEYAIKEDNDDDNDEDL